MISYPHDLKFDIIIKQFVADLVTILSLLFVFCGYRP
jgi:hypothetical protein